MRFVVGADGADRAGVHDDDAVGGARTTRDGRFVLVLPDTGRIQGRVGVEEGQSRDILMSRRFPT
jgi:hypothetical protein